MKITVVKDYRGQEEIHKAGCADLKRRNRPYRLSEALTMDVETLRDLYQVYWECIDEEAVANGDYPDVEHAWYAWTGEFDVKPCAASVPEMADPDAKPAKRTRKAPAKASPEPAPEPAPAPVTRSEAKADLARRILLAVEEAMKGTDESDLFRAVLSPEEAAQTVANWMAHLPAGTVESGARYWPAGLPRPTAKRGWNE